MNKDNCKVGQSVTYFPNKELDEVEFGVVTELRNDWAMVLYEGDTISKATYYTDLEGEPKTLAPVGKKIN
jgi:hypothetical protein